jgi:putative aldouronate transport system permease protein
LGLQNKIWALIIPYLFNAWYVIILRTFFTLNIPESLIEAAKIDGAGEFKIFFKMIIPLSLPGIATIALFQTLAYWNDWWLALMLTSSKAELANLQFLLYRILTNIQAIADNPAASASLGNTRLPAESMRMALCIIAIGPIVLAYPFFQKYFVKGLTVGAVKG